MRINLYALTAALLILSPPATAGSEEIAILEGLNKTTGRVFKLEVAMGSSITWGKLEIRPTRCVKAPPEQLPENATFLEVRETTHSPQSDPLFKGWMFSSSPSLSSLEHPIYDIIVLDCYSLPESGEQPAVLVESLPPMESNR
jgi:hypothetical protein